MHRFLTLVFLLGISSPLFGQGPSDLVFRLSPPANSGQGTSETVLHTTSFGGDSGMSGYALSVCFDPLTLAATSVTEGSDLLAAVEDDPSTGGSVFFFDVTIEADRLALGVVLSGVGISVIDPGCLPRELTRLEFEIIGGSTGSTLPIEFCSWGIHNNVGVFAGASITPYMVVEEIPEGCLFLRGDGNQDGQLDLADVIFTAQLLFTVGVGLTCSDRYDSNDDGVTNIADVVYSATYLFQSGAPIAPPFPNCGFDPTPDGLVCDESTLNCP